MNSNKQNKQWLAVKRKMGDRRYTRAPRLIVHRFGDKYGLYSPFFSRWLVADELCHGILKLFSSPVAFDALMAGLKTLCRSEREYKAAPGSISTLIDDHMIVERRITDKRCLAEARRDFKNDNIGIRSLLIMFSLKCNFHCTYCYHLSSFSRLDLAALNFDTIKKAIDLFVANYKGELVPKFVFIGGEPLLHLDLLQKSIAYIQELNSASAFGKNEPAYAVQTNASLITDKIAGFFKEHGCGVGVSIDGTAGVHDKFRRYPKGAGTFKDVMRGIRCLRSNNADFYITLTVGTHNIDSLEKEIKWLGRNVSKFIKLNFMCDFFEGINDVVPDEDKLFFKLANVYDLCISEGITEYHLEASFERFEKFGSINRHCDATGSQIVLSPYGTIGPCHHLAATRDQKYFFPLSNKKINVHGAPQWREWLKRTPLLNENCADKCGYITLCGGGCAANALAKGLKLSDYDPFACKLVKFYLRYFLKLKSESQL